MRGRTVIGVDPDAVKHGVAIFHEGQLLRLKLLETYDLVELARAEECVLAIEHVTANKHIYAKHKRRANNAKVRDQIAIKVGRVQQAQVELCRMLDRFDVKYRLIRPMVGNWSHNKREFELITGWTRPSGEDTRAAAFYGYTLQRLEAQGKLL